MKNSTTLFILVFLAFSRGFCQTESQPENQHSLLWKIEGKDLSSPSYLFGTIHLISKKDFFLPDSLETFLGRSRLVAFEINIEDMMNLSAQLSLVMNAFMSDNLTLKDLLTPEDYQLVQAHFKKMGLPLFLFERMKPMFLMVFASMDMTQGMGMGDMVSYEIELMDKAKARGLAIGALETAEYQMSMFDSIPYKEQAEMLMRNIKNTKAGDEEFNKMVDLYKRQDIEQMVDMLGEDQGIGTYEDLLLVTRNKNWIPVMGQMMRRQPTFFAVGAGHLGGENGVISLLRSEGYKLTPVR